MQQYLYSIFFISLFFFSSRTIAQVVSDYPMVEIQKDTSIHFRPFTQEIVYSHIPYQRRARIRGRGKEQFNVTYIGNVPEEAKHVFEEGVLSVLGDLIRTPVKINIHLTYRIIDGTALAGASVSRWYSNFRNSPKINGVFPVALAEKIAGFEINDPESPDLEIRVNSNIDWFYRVEDATGIGPRFDFFSVLLHEVLHGLGFNSSVSVQDGIGIIGVFTNNRFTAFVDYLVNEAGQKLTSFEDQTSNMASRLSRNDLFWNSEVNHTKFKLFSPTPYQPGSSISHLDHNTYQNTDDALMTPFANRGQAIRDPGISTEIMHDLGWSHTYLLHDRPSNTVERSPFEKIPVQIRVESDARLDSSTLFINYRLPFPDFEGNRDFKEPMEYKGGDLFEFELPAFETGDIMLYYFEAADINGRFFTNPGYDVLNKFQVYYDMRYGLDTIPPVIVHEPIAQINDKDRSLDLETIVSDGYTGVESVTVEWKMKGEEMGPVLMEVDTANQFGENNYIAKLPIPLNFLSEGDEIEYRIIAIDRAISKNSSFMPEDGSFFIVEVTAVPSPVVSYFNDFNTPTDDFEGNGFSIERPVNFNNPAIHSLHPYPSAGQNNTLNLIYNLKVPIIVDSKNPLMEFDEIVLIEPGEPGFAFGTLEFWDYVIVEGRKLGTNQWLPIIDGYDSRAHVSWLNTYNSSISAGNSTAVGHPSMFRKRSIDITDKGNFVAGDTVLFRFRLFSDPFAVGWGWAIDNLNIQDQSTSVIDLTENNDVLIFPNPVTGDRIYIKRPVTDAPEALVYLFTLDGRLLSKTSVNEYEFSIPVTDQSNMLILTIQSGKSSVSKKIFRAGR
ncbi:MAG TPA: hypothetical protein PKC30_16535 [Saprospiraceae bacterium]|nr:hypothetical protein [Saprospiraceae bacterium]